MSNNLTIERHRVRITVLKKYFHREFIDKYAADPERWTECRHFEVGQEFLTSLEAPWEMPDGFCGWAWTDIHKYVLAIVCGGNFAPWVKEKGTAIACCTDGYRPVVFKIEAIG